jgi:Uma2 family endonuclease
MTERGRTDFFAGGDMFVYYSYEQARDVASGRPYFRGPDVFYVDGVERRRERKAWVAWEEGGRLPDVIVELLSPSTAKIDRTVKKDLYARTFRTPEYFLYEPHTEKLEGFRLAGDVYKPLTPNVQGRLWSAQLGLEIGLWHGEQTGEGSTWVRLFHPDGRLVPTPAERAEAERERADAAEAELKRLRALLDGRT